MSSAKVVKQSNKNYVECQYPFQLSSVNRAVAMQLLAQDYQSVQCSAHGLYHSWTVPASYATHNDIRRKVDMVRVEGYRRLRNGRFLPVDKKQKEGSNNDT